MIALQQLGAFLRRDLLVEASYRVNWLFDLGSGAVSLLVVWFLGRAIGPAEALAPYGGSYFAFAVIGFAALGPTYRTTAPPAATSGRHHSAATGGGASARATATA